MNVIAHAVLLAWFPLLLCLSAYFPRQKLVAFALVFGWMALPNDGYSLRGLPDYTKMSATVLALLTAALIFGSKRLFAFRYRWFDTIPILVCVAPLISSLTNHLGIYDGLSVTLSALFVYGLPYLVGRTQLNDHEGIRILCIAVIVGSVLYIPLCLLEVRLSPQLHNWVYGSQHRWNGSGYRYGGWRPIVFLDGGLQLAMWMTNATLLGAWLYWKRVWRRSFGMSAGLLLCCLLTTTVLCRSVGAIILLLLGATALCFTEFTRTRLALLILLLIPPAYITVRLSSDWGLAQATEVSRLISDARAQSLQFRFENEELLIYKALERPVFGWGGWGRSRVFDEYGKDLTVTDGLWIIQLGQFGLFGLVSLYALLSMPLGLLLWRYSAKRLLTPYFAAALVLALCVTLSAIDSLPNAMPTPLLMVAIGAIAGCTRIQDTVNEQLLADNGEMRSFDVLPRKLAIGVNSVKVR